MVRTARSTYELSRPVHLMISTLGQPMIQKSHGQLLQEVRVKVLLLLSNRFFFPLSYCFILLAFSNGAPNTIVAWHGWVSSCYADTRHQLIFNINNQGALVKLQWSCSHQLQLLLCWLPSCCYLLILDNPLRRSSVDIFCFWFEGVSLLKHWKTPSPTCPELVAVLPSLYNYCHIIIYTSGFYSYGCPVVYGGEWCFRVCCFVCLLSKLASQSG